MGQRERYRDNQDGCLAAVYTDAQGSHAGVAEAIGISVPTASRWIRAHKLTGTYRKPPTPRPETTGKPVPPERAGATIEGDNATLISSPNPMGTGTLEPDDLLRAHGLDPSEWTYDAKLNRWDALAGDGRVTTLCQLRLNARRKVRVDLLMPARAPGWTPDRRVTPRVSIAEPEVVVVCSDPHWPYVEADLHRAMVRMLADLKPTRAFDLGDGLDIPNPSRHKRNPRFDASLQECLDGEYGGWLDRIDASPDTEWVRLPGNHDQRVRDAQLERLAAIYGVRRAQVEAELEDGGEFLPVLDIGYLLRLDELGVTMVRPDGDGEYHGAQVRIAPGLLAGHGTKSGRFGGATKAGERLTCSWMQGHDHKQALAFLSRWDDEGRAGDAALASVGTLAQRDLGYVDHAEVQQGLATVMVWPDGRFHIELARWDGGELVYRDRRY